MGTAIFVSLIFLVVGAGVVMGLRELFGAMRELGDPRGEVARGDTRRLLVWAPAGVADLSDEYIGATSYTRGIIGKSDSGSGLLRSLTRPGYLMAWHAEATQGGLSGSIDALSSATRYELRISQGVVQVWVARAPLGELHLATGEIRGPDTKPLGGYARGLPAAAWGQLFLRGAPVALVSKTSWGSTKRSAQPTPMFTQVAVHNQEAESWAVAVALLETGFFGVHRSNDAMSRRPSLRFR